MDALQKALSKTVKVRLGTFALRRPSLPDRLQISVRTARYLQGQDNVDVAGENLAIMFATLDIAIVKKPDDFDWSQVYDYDDLMELYNEWLEFDKSFRKPVEAKQEEVGAGSSPDL
ncbi:MAG: hypothetical protein ACYCX4_01740 [Bacillota bacterium]